MYDEQDAFPKSDDTNGSLTEGNSPDAFETDVATQLAAFHPIGGEIEVTSSALKLGRYSHFKEWIVKIRISLMIFLSLPRDLYALIKYSQYAPFRMVKVCKISSPTSMSLLDASVEGRGLIW